MADGVVLKGMDELIESVDVLIQKYPDRMGDFLRDQAMEARKGVAKEAKAAVDVDMSERYSLGRPGNYAVSQIKGYGTQQYVEVSAKSPHFHLIENGHELASHNGRSIGWVPGYKIMDAETKRRKVTFPAEFGKMAAKLLEEEGFL